MTSSLDPLPTKAVTSISNSTKNFYSPFGTLEAKPKVSSSSSSDTLYEPPALTDELPSTKKRDATPVAKYLSTESTKKFFQPFGIAGEENPKASSSSSTKPLYGPTALGANEDETIIISDRTDEKSGSSSYLEALSGTGSSLKSSYSAFGLSKSKRFASSDDDLYDTKMRGEETESLPAPSPSSASSFLKRSFSPFGSSMSYISEISTNTPYTPLDNIIISDKLSDNVAISDIDRHHHDTGIPLALNEYTDRSKNNFTKNTEEEYQQEDEPMLNKNADMTKDEYSNVLRDVPPTSMDSSYDDEDIQSTSNMNGGFSQEVELDMNEDSTIDAFETKQKESEYLESLIQTSVMQPTSTNILYSSSNGEVNRDLVRSDIPDLPTIEGDKILAAYTEWCRHFKKQYTESRVKIFSAHYQAVRKFHEENGTPLMLNEFSDLTEEEYNAVTSTDVSMIDDHYVVEDRIVLAYKQWCDFFDKDFNENRLKVFASNFLILEQYYGHDDSSFGGQHMLAFNEYSDLTEEEYLQGEGRIRIAYKEWCAYYGKKSDLERYRTFSNHFRVIQKHTEETGVSLVLNEYADMIEEDYNMLSSSTKKTTANNHNPIITNNNN